ncbi:MAG TPA: YbaK/EbsC family protein [Rhabdaerophilum sp.]|nr:YbaK/EbsC family protein [Rhabdaerophilum sp.]
MSAAEKLDSLAGRANALSPTHQEPTATTKRVLDAMTRAALPYELKMLPEGIRSDEEIAAFCDCEINFIAKTTIMRGKATKKPVLLIYSAASKLNEKQIGLLVGENLQRADADFVRRLTGYPIESVPPLAHLNRVPVLFDSALMRFARIWCPCGSPDAVCSVPTLVLARAISARTVPLDSGH